MKQSAGNREQLIRERSDTFTGVDFVHVVDACDQRVLHVYFITDARELSPGFDGTGALRPEDIEIVRDGDAAAKPLRVLEIEEVAGSQVQLQATFDRTYLALHLEEPGGFGNYRLRIIDPLTETDPPTLTASRVDPVFNDILFDFKAGCEGEVDCKQPADVCPPEELVDFPVDYLARDFTSLRGALLDYAAQRFPDWVYPIEADVGVMLAEVFAALGDEFSYLQDRYAREAYLETATERRTLRKKARLVDFELHDGRSPVTWLSLEVDPTIVLPANPPEVLPRPSRAWARSEGGESIAFEVGFGLHDDTDHVVHPTWNESALIPYCYDERHACLPVGAQELTVVGTVAHPDVLSGSDPPRRMLLATTPDDPAVPSRRLFVTVDQVETTEDPLFPGQPLTHIRWREPLPYQIDQNVLALSLNVVPATAGETIVETFITRATVEGPGETHAVVRQGPLSTSGISEPESAQRAVDRCAGSGRDAARSPIVLFGLTATATQGLGFTGAALRTSLPEIRLRRTDTVEEWNYARQVLAAGPGDNVFTLEDGLWRRIRRFRNETDEYIHQDYATSAGYSLRFGDGEFGRIPPAGALFEVTYRTGPGSRANVPAGSVSARSARADSVDPGGMPAYVSAFSNPLAVKEGVDPESAADVRLLAPEAYRRSPLFAVRPDDYRERAEDLAFVQRAAATTRWTGTWQATFVTVDPVGRTELDEQQLAQTEGWMDCVRQAGREVRVVQPKFVPLDLRIIVCIEPYAYAAHVLTQVRAVLTTGLADQKPFFHPDHFTFGTPLQRAALEAAVQAVPGVRSVRGIWARLRGVRPLARLYGLTLNVAADQVLRLDDDPSNPDGGTLQLLAEGGA